MQIALDLIPILARDSDMKSELQRRGYDELVIRPSVVVSSVVHMVVSEIEYQFFRCARIEIEFYSGVYSRSGRQIARFPFDCFGPFIEPFGITPFLAGYSCSDR